ncbi:hypothetical protein K461DRAFT_298161 [Myriangium duriaei CBS 260.36]|uniref:BTB domain-containing protein n=1 Tax=Myriangium duriaei CBS 260.36 TaxID=1168546 RepID=A0A9P4MCP8_9PEZI|nr:hypothetical protein K461DRAFT_298161 [Myriangium duriaei CBS 260.36]
MSEADDRYTPVYSPPSPKMYDNDTVNNNDTIVLFEGGDVIIKACSEDAVREFLVSSEVLGRTSNVFSSFLDLPRTKAGGESRRLPWIRPITEDPDSVEIILRVLHGQLDYVPTGFDFDSLGKLEHAANTLGCVDKMSLVVAYGLRTINVNELDLAMTTKYAAIAMRFNLAELFRTVTKHCAQRFVNPLVHVWTLGAGNLKTIALAIQLQQSSVKYAIHAAVTALISSCKSECGCLYTLGSQGNATLLENLQTFYHSPLTVAYTELLFFVKYAESSCLFTCEEHLWDTFMECSLSRSRDQAVQSLEAALELCKGLCLECIKKDSKDAGTCSGAH